MTAPTNLLFGDEPADFSLALTPEEEAQRARIEAGWSDTQRIARGRNDTEGVDGAGVKTASVLDLTPNAHREPWWMRISNDRPIDLDERWKESVARRLEKVRAKKATKEEAIQ